MACSNTHSASTDRTRAAGTVSSPTQSGVCDVNVGVVRAHDPAPQQRRQGPGVGEVGADIHPQQYRENGA